MRFFVKRRRNFKICYKTSKHKISPIFLLIWKESDTLNMFYKFQFHSMHICFQNGDFKCQKTEKGCIHPSPSDFNGLPYPSGKVVPPFFFIKMTAKDVKEKRLPICPRPFFFFVSERPGKTVRGLQPPP